MDTDYIRMIEHQGQSILFFDFSQCCDDDNALDRIDQARRKVAQLPRKSVLTLVDVSESRFNTKLIQACRELALHNEPYVIASAFIGISDVSAMVLKGVGKLTGRDFHFFKTAAEAKSWLSAQQVVAA